MLEKDKNQSKPEGDPNEEKTKLEAQEQNGAAGQVVRAERERRRVEERITSDVSMLKRAHAHLWEVTYEELSKCREKLDGYSRAYMQERGSSQLRITLEVEALRHERALARFDSIAVSERNLDLLEGPFREVLSRADDPSKVEKMWESGLKMLCKDAVLCMQRKLEPGPDNEVSAPTV